MEMQQNAYKLNELKMGIAGGQRRKRLAINPLNGNRRLWSTKLAEWKWDVKSLEAKLSQVPGQACLAKFIKHLTNRAHQGNLMCFGVIQLNKVPKFLAQFSSVWFGSVRFGFPGEEGNVA